MGSPEYEDLRVVVTGGSGALGQAVVAVLLERGAHCHVPVFDDTELAQWPYLDRERVTVHRAVDLRDPEAVATFYDAVGPLWASIQTAGGFAMAPVAETSMELWRTQLELNATTCFLCCQAAVRKIRSSGTGGRIVNVTARPALVPTGGMVAYAASKAVVASLTSSLASELAGESIWVNAVVPSTMDTPANRAAMPNADPSRWASVEAVAATVAFLASPSHRCTRGGLIPVYGRTG